MLATEKISRGFIAIIEEAEKLTAKDLPEEVVSGLKTIISIAKHQSDIRGATGETCSSSEKRCG